MDGETCLFIAEFSPNLTKRSQFIHNLIIGTPGKITLTALVVPPEEISLSIASDLIGRVENQFRIGGMDSIFNQDDDFGLRPEVLQHVWIRAEMACPINHTSGEN